MKIGPLKLAGEGGWGRFLPKTQLSLRSHILQGFQKTIFFVENI